MIHGVRGDSGTSSEGRDLWQTKPKYCTPGWILQAHAYAAILKVIR